MDGSQPRTFQAEKEIVRAYYTALDRGDDTSPYCAEALVWRGFHPFGLLTGRAEVEDAFWTPLRRALTPMQRRLDVFIAGLNEMDGFQSVWVASMGHLMGLFDAPWLGIEPTRKIAMLRYAAFHKVEDGRIVEEAMFFDLPHLMVQAGYRPFGPQTAAELVQPGPMTHSGVMTDPQDPERGEATLATINAMIADLGTWQLGLPLEDELRRTWAEDMIWWGPTGIGATYTIPRYARQHSGPFRAAFTDRAKTGHLCRMAEGDFGGFFGWPNFTARHVGGFMGMPASDRQIEFRVIDIYRAGGGKLHENWVFIDLLHAWHQLGTDILGRVTAIGRV
ncbi:ester cyclase [Pseudaestuariivita atlantica]|uniref:Polyketide cyclase n=1 Tax=Pseudaestuariivita atlantica TaxID=1317121 RepID=A0A0L1JQ01_9RHOB|nr:nuclear transport factor 2 family protein [Pseudaestuariivita atlantica]KNG93849.1 polyketide cyclase [Pseudaestuariivita atlantica]